MFLVSSRSCLCPIHWSQVFSREWRCNWSSVDRRCSNFIWVIKNCFAYCGASYIRGSTVCRILLSCIYMSLSWKYIYLDSLLTYHVDAYRLHNVPTYNVQLVYVSDMTVLTFALAVTIVVMLAIIALVAMRAKQAAYERDLLAANWKVEQSELGLYNMNKVWGLCMKTAFSY